MKGGPKGEERSDGCVSGLLTLLSVRFFAQLPFVSLSGRKLWSRTGSRHWTGDGWSGLTGTLTGGPKC